MPTTIKTFIFSDFHENTYVLSTENKDCWIIDPGCYFPEEWEELRDYITENGLNPVRLLNTHCHLDHVFGNALVCKEYGLAPEYHEKESPVIASVPAVAEMYGIRRVHPSPVAERFIVVGETLSLGDARFEVLFAPGHSPGHVCFYNKIEQFVIAGDVLFRESIGRTDLPGGDHQTLLDSIKRELFSLPEATKVYCGHGPATDIRHEKVFNPFL